MPATTKKPIKIVPNTIKTIPKVPLSPISKSKSFQEKLNDIQNNIDINIDDIPEDLLDIWDELQEDITPKLISKNYKLWLTIFTPFILPGIINGMSGKPAVPQPVVTVQEPAPDPKQIVNFAQKYFAEHGLELCKSLTKTDLNSMKQDLINNWGKGPDAFSKAFQDSYPVSKSRLENIYRSERHLAEYNGVLERAKIADHKYKQWRAVGDERSCDLCMSHDMEIVPINEPFSNGEMTATGHPQCRCSMVTYSDEDYNEMKEDSAYLDDVVNTIKLNYNCPDSEKQGTGPGSCGGGKTNKSSPEKEAKENNTHINIATSKNDMIQVRAKAFQERYPTEKFDAKQFEKNWKKSDEYKEFEPLSNDVQNEIISSINKVTNDIPAFRGATIILSKGHPEKGGVDAIADAYTDESGVIIMHESRDTTRNQVSGPEDKNYLCSGSLYDNTYAGTFAHEMGHVISFKDKSVIQRAGHIKSEENDLQGRLSRMDPKEIAAECESIFHGGHLNKFNDKTQKAILYVVTGSTKLDNTNKPIFHENTAYLADAFETIKLNYNCPDSEKVGSGPGSCSGGNTSNLDKVSTLKNKIRELEKSVSEGKSTFDEAYEQYKSIQKELDLELEKEKLRNPDNAKITNDIVTDPEPITPYKALSDYQNYAYTAINDYLRKTNYVKQNPQQTKNIQNMIKTIDSEMENNTLKSDKLVFRADGAGISSDAFEKTGLTNIFKDTFGKESLTLEDFIKNPKLIDKIREKLVGYEYTEKAYLSTGSDKENTMNRFLAPSRDISKYGVTGLINLIVPKGTPAIRIADYTGLEDELGGKIDEYLIGRDQTIVIDQVYIRPADDDRLYLEYNAHIKTNEQKQNSEYLEDVTNFIKLNYKCKAGTVDDSNKCELENSDVPETRTFHEENIKSKILSLNDSKYPKDAVFRSKSRSNMTKNVELDILNNDNHVKILSDNIDKLHYQCDNLKIPRLRGIVADKNTKAGLASMADGILAVTPDMFRNDPDSEVDLRLSRNQERLNYINNKLNLLESLIQSDKEKWTKNNKSLVESGMKFEESTFYKTGYPWPKEIKEYETEKNSILTRINDLNTKKTNALIYTWKPGMPDSEKPFGASEYFPFEQSPKLLLDHEFGHHIHQLYGVKNAKSYAEPPLEKKIDQIYKKSEKDGTLIVPSKYAASDHQEWFAESYSLYVNGRDDLVTPGLIDLFKKIGVKHDN